ncbi:MAG TPA: hypothetical protein VF701_19245, partial [Thermoanaerobaculia bacterium]
MTTFRFPCTAFRLDRRNHLFRVVPHFLLLALLLVLSSPLLALPPRELRDDVPERLRTSSTTGHRVVIEGVPLGRVDLDRIEVEPMQVWADDAKVVVYLAGGSSEVHPVPDTRYFRGRVVGSDESAVFLALDRGGRVTGLILDGHRQFRLGHGVRREKRSRLQVQSVDGPLLVGEIDAIDALASEQKPWVCDLEGATVLSR